MSIDLTTSCVCQYRMNDNAANTTVLDSVGSFNGTAQANTNTLDTTGKINGALTFNGTTDYIGIFRTGSDASKSIFGNSFSFNFWEYPITWNASLMAVETKQDIYDSGIDLSCIFLSMGYWHGGVEYSTGVILPDNYWALGTSYLSNWQMFTVVVEQTTSTSITVKLNANAVLIKEQVVADFNLVDFATIFCDEDFEAIIPIGCYRNKNEDLSEFVNGSLDDVRIFNKALSASEIGFLYYGGSGTEKLTGELGEWDSNMSDELSQCLGF
jgi:hypothetical protein